VGSAVALPNAIAILTSVFPPKERGKALGMNLASVYLGLSLGPFLGGVLTQHLGWRSIFYFCTFLCLVVIVFVLWKFKGEWAEAGRERFDLAGSVACVISLLVTMYGFTVLPSIPGFILVAVGLLGILAFIRWEMRVASPVLNIGLFRKNAVFVFSNLAALVNYSATYAITFLLSLYLQYVKGFSPQTAGLVLIASPVMMTIFAPIAGRLSDRFEPRKVASVGMSFTCVALVLFVFLSDVTAMGYIIGGLVIFGFGAGLFSSPNVNAIMGSVTSKHFGIASGTQATMRSLGMVLSMGIAMILFSIYIGKAQVTPEYYPALLTSMKVGFVIFAALCFGGVLAQLAGRKASLE
jgi:MFS family permease